MNEYTCPRCKSAGMCMPDYCIRYGAPCPDCAAKDALLDRQQASWTAEQEIDHATIAALRQQVAELREALVELALVAHLRDDDVLPLPCDDPKLWSARMQSAWDQCWMLIQNNPQMIRLFETLCEEAYAALEQDGGGAK